MAHEADDQEVEAAALDELDDGRHRVAGDDMGLELDPLGFRLRQGLVAIRRKKRLASVCSSTTSSMVVAKRGSSSTEIM